MVTPDAPYNKVDEFEKDVLPVLNELKTVLDKHGINYFFSACVAQHVPTDGKDLITFTSNTGHPTTEYNCVKFVEFLRLLQGQGVFVSHPMAAQNGIYVPVVTPKNPKNN